METSVGVFISRTTAEEAVKELMGNGVPKDSIVFLTRSDSEAVFADLDMKYAGVFAGGATGLSIAAVTLLAVPGIGQVVAVGFGAAALLGLVGAGAGAAAGKALASSSERPQPTDEPKANDDAVFFREVLQRNRSLVVVRTESHEISKTATVILDSLGIGMEGRTSIRMRTNLRQTGPVNILDVSGRITVGEGNLMLREIVQGLIDRGSKYVVLNLSEVEYVDSAGIGELIRSLIRVRNAGGQLKLLSPNKKVQDLLEATNLHRVFDIRTDEAEAIKSFDIPMASGATQ